ncbi:MAG: OmpA family protein [Deltaproteobacteria bacterium]|jgi:outer membrane protein OmpA-like peptidoglycan-associated protein|nr:OmpA family protein [Deltaproteobacteria bacterium]
MRRLLVALAVVAVMTAELGAQNFDPEVIVSRQLTADQGLFFALAQSNIVTMGAMRDQGADPNINLSRLGLKPQIIFDPDLPIFKQPFNTAGWPILTWAVYLNNEKAVNLLLRAGARVNAPDEYGATALHWAAWAGRHSVAKILLNNGANCQALDFKGRTPKDWAIMVSQSDMIRLIDSRSCRAPLDGDADRDGVPDSRDQCPGTPLGAPVDDRGCWVVAYAAFFDFDRAIIKKEFLPHIRQAARVLSNNPDIDVVIEGHTDYVGTEEYNYGLGLRRAQAVKRELVRNGVSASRLSETSKGENQPIEDNSTSKGRSRNRRVEIHVTQQPRVGGE